MMRGIVIGWLFAVLTFGIGAVIGANWYEHHIYVNGDPNPIDMVNIHGWELTSHEGSIWKLRRPRLRLH